MRSRPHRSSARLARLAVLLEVGERRAAQRRCERALLRVKPGLASLLIDPHRAALMSLAPGAAFALLVDAALDAPVAERDAALAAAERALGGDDSILGRALGDMDPERTFDPRWLRDALDAAREEAHLGSYPTRGELQAHATRRSGRIWRAVLRATGRSGDRSRVLADSADVARMLSQWLREFDAHLERGQLYLPVELLLEAKLTPEQMLHAQEPERAAALTKHADWIAALLHKARGLEGLAGPPTNWLVRRALDRSRPRFPK